MYHIRTTICFSTTRLYPKPNIIQRWVRIWDVVRCETLLVHDVISQLGLNKNLQIITDTGNNTTEGKSGVEAPRLRGTTAIMVWGNFFF